MQQFVLTVKLLTHIDSMSSHKRDSTAADLPYPTTTHHRPPSPDSDDGPRAVPDFLGSSPSGSNLPPSTGTPSTYTTHNVMTPFHRDDVSTTPHTTASPFTYTQYGYDRTVHTVNFKLWNPDDPNKQLFVRTNNYDPEHFFFKLTGHQEKAHRLSDYWRSHYGVPLVHATSTSLGRPLHFAQFPLSTASISDLAATLHGKLFGPNGPFDLHGTTDETTSQATDINITERRILDLCLTSLGISTIDSSSHMG